MIAHFQKFNTTQTTLAVAITLLTLVFLVYFISDCLKHKEDFTKTKLIPLGLIGAIANFFDTLGIGSFATSQAGFKFTKSCEDELMPGTLNVGNTLPVVIQFILFMTIGNVAGLTLAALIGSAAIGAIIGASIVSKLSVDKIRYALGAALIILAVVILSRLMSWGPFAGNSADPNALQQLLGWRLIVGIIVNFFLGALMTVGVGLYAPCMALVGALGLNLDAAFPIMMGSCAFLMPSAGIKFIKEGKYDRKAAIMISLFGSIGVFLAYFLVSSLQLRTLTFIVLLVMLYTAFTFFRDAARSTAK